MKRVKDIYKQIYAIENLQLADAKARKGKKNQYGVKLHDLNQEANIQALHTMLKDKTYKTSEYTTFKVYEPKEREVFRLPYFPDRITHHAVMNILEPLFVASFTADSYSCIKGKGIHAAARAVKKALKDIQGTQYCLKLDITKFYPNIDHDVLKQLLRRKFKDNDLLWLLDEIIDSTDGLPIGNYLSQYLANFYLTYFDHWLKEQKQVYYYFRYADDMVILAGSKPYLHELLADIRHYLDTELKLQVKGNYQVFPVKARGIDFVGYVFYHTHTLIRKGIKQNFAQMLARRPNRASTASYLGWCKHANTKNLTNKLLPQNESFQRLRDHASAANNEWRQNQNGQDSEQGNQGTSLPHSGFHGKAGYQAAGYADKHRPGNAGNMERINCADGNHPASTEREISLSDNNSKR